MCIRDRADTDHRERVYQENHRLCPGQIPVSYTHLDVYKRQAIVRSRLPVGYNPAAPAPVIWLNFLDGLLHAEDIHTLQEFIGYCLIPSNKGQRMMVIKGNAL